MIKNSVLPWSKNKQCRKVMRTLLELKLLGLRDLQGLRPQRHGTAGKPENFCRTFLPTAAVVQPAAEVGHMLVYFRKQVYTGGGGSGCECCFASWVRIRGVRSVPMTFLSDPGERKTA